MVIAERTAATMTTSLSLCARIRDLAEPEARLERFEVERKAMTWWVYGVKRDDTMKESGVSVLWSYKSPVVRPNNHLKPGEKSRQLIHMPRRYQTWQFPELPSPASTS